MQFKFRKLSSLIRREYVKEVFNLLIILGVTLSLIFFPVILFHLPRLLYGELLNYPRAREFYIKLSNLTHIKLPAVNSIIKSQHYIIGKITIYYHAYTGAEDWLRAGKIWWENPVFPYIFNGCIFSLGNIVIAPYNCIVIIKEYLVREYELIIIPKGKRYAILVASFMERAKIKILPDGKTVNIYINKIKYNITSISPQTIKNWSYELEGTYKIAYYLKPLGLRLRGFILVHTKSVHIHVLDNPTPPIFEYVIWYVKSEKP